MKIITTIRRYSIIDVQPDDLAAQLTLIDLPIFKAIKMEEFTCLNDGSASRRQTACPNIAAMKRQFNQVTFWVVGQILSQGAARHRAELISHFIKTAKRLYLLNNLHSSNAVLSALLSSPIYRLEKTWHIVRKKYPKERAQLDSLRNLFSDNNNYESLRKHLDQCSLPCIPYLGMYSRDIIYINEAHQKGTMQRTKSTSKILDSIEKFQLSQYDHLVLLPEIHDCLLSSRYIDELQKFIEDDNYRRSLELEPSPMQLDHDSSVDQQRAPGDPTDLLSGGRHSSTHGHRRTNMLAGLTSMVHTAVVTTSNKFGGGSAATSSNQKGSSFCLQKSLKYLIDDSFIHSHPLSSINSSSSGIADISHPEAPPIQTSS